MGIQIFNSPLFGDVRTAGTSDNPLFCLSDICKALGLTVKGVNQRLGDEVISTYPIVDSLGRTQQALFVNEDGLYDVILDSRKPEAKKFRKWITSEVLPAIRKTGGYIATKEDDTPEEIMARALLVAKDTLKRKEERLRELQRQNEVQKGTIEQQSEQLKRQAPKVEYADKVLSSTGTYGINIIAKEMGMSGTTLNRKLKAMGVQYRQGRTWLPTAKYQDKGYTDSSTYPYIDANGEQRSMMRTVWTEKGRAFIHRLIQDERNSAKTNNGKKGGVK